MVALHGETIEPVPLAQVAGKLKLVPPSCETIRQAKAIGVCFGD